jgi:hypothetical protein
MSDDEYAEPMRRHAQDAPGAGPPYEFRRRSVRGLLEETLALVRRQLPALALPAALVLGVFEVPAFLLASSRAVETGGPSPVESPPALLQIASSIAGLCASLVVTFVAGQLCAGRRPGLQESLAGGLRALGRSLWTALLVVLVLALAVFLLVVLGLVLRDLGLPPPVLLVLGAASLSLLALATFSCSLLLGPLCVLERLAGPRAIRRNRALTKGRLGRGLGVLLLGSVITFGFVVLSGTVIGWAPVVGPMAMLGAQAAATAFSASLLTLLYLDLRIRHEGLGLDAWRAAVGVEPGGGGVP